VSGALCVGHGPGATTMKRGCLLWLLGVPLPVVVILYLLFFR
jgi:hypothetical protein